MSNIYTEHARLYFRPGITTTPREMEILLERVLGERGSYWVPVWYELSWPSHVDFQYGSGKGAGLYNLDPEDLELFEDIWVRFADEGSDQDVIYERFVPSETSLRDEWSPRRFCHYAFDEVHVITQPSYRRLWLPEDLSWDTMPGGFRAAFGGKYLALNERADMEIGPGARLRPIDGNPEGFPTPSTPHHGNRAPTFLDAPETFIKLLMQGQPSVERIDLLYRGRIVHRATWHTDEEDFRGTYWRHRCADHWDNCVDEEFVRSHKTDAR